VAIFVTNFTISRKINIFESRFDKIYRRIQEISFVAILSLLGFLYFDSVYGWIKAPVTKICMDFIIIIIVCLNIIFEIAIMIKNLLSEIIDAIKVCMKKKNKI
jgi:hypothetical protein